ncbi:E3 ubiquitin-protein ligase PRT6-like isoform X2 [Curcuma longa]|uniref:E3 ubiquitin-protein ligase PRT6-like isoform X2 n=1 Tax=Curcuma longa TaxID=136217 RepID=UPI003D9FAB77
MELDSPWGGSPRLLPRDRIVQRLAAKGVPHEILDQFETGLSFYLDKNRTMVKELVSAILPTEGDISELSMLSGGSNIADFFSESMSWLGWLMFGGEPQKFLENLAKKAGGQRAVCGSIWGPTELAYRCRTCESDPTCAICVPCFLNGNHKDHDYSIMYTNGGCCDCGDETAWKIEGFCSEHGGIGKIQPLPEELANSIMPILDDLLMFWKNKITLAEKSKSQSVYRTSDVSSEMSEKLSSAVVKMLLHFCDCSDSLLSFTSKRMLECVGLLDVLVRAERFLHQDVTKKLHGLLLKLLEEPGFKYEFAKVFIRYYPFALHEMTKEGNDTALSKYPLLSTFSVQIFTVTPLMTRLVPEVNLLGILLECLRDLLLFSVGESGEVQATRWVMDLMINLVQDIRYSLSHEEVLVHVIQEQPDILRFWLKLLTLAQGMNPHKGVTTTPTWDEYGNISTAFFLGHLIGKVSNLLIQVAFSASKVKQWKNTPVCHSVSEELDNSEGHHHSKLGRTSEDSSACNMRRCGQLDCSSKYNYGKLDGIDSLSLPPPAIRLTFECLKSIDRWLCFARNIFNAKDVTQSSSFNSLRKKVFRLKKGANSYKVCRTSSSELATYEHQLLALGVHLGRFDSMDTDMCPDDTSSSRLSDANIMERDTISEAFGMLNMADWTGIIHDVSSQGISFHIPLHCFLSLILRKATEYFYGETEKPETKSKGILLPSSFRGHDFFGQVLGGCQPFGFSACLMEHPLRMRVFCAQVRAGMWRRSGETAIWMSEFYCVGPWNNQGLESDLFLLQCCAALAPPELFVKRIQEKFGLLNYTSLNISEHNEYEAVLVHEMLTLIIQIVKERSFSGRSLVDRLKGEMIYKLAVGDATRSQVVKALPRDLSKSDQVQTVLDTLATYSIPSSMKQGKYSLRHAYWKELDLYHPRWSYRDLQIAEERYFRFCKVSAHNAQLPQWTHIYSPFATISRIATSKTVLEIIRAVFFYAAFADVSPISRAPEGVLITALHLLALALDVLCSQSNMSVNNYDPDSVSFMEVLHNQEGLSSLLSHATDLLDVTLQCKSDVCKNQNMLSLLVLLMRKYKEEDDKDNSEMRHCNISLLIETLLKKFAELNNDCLIVIQNLAPEMVPQMLKHCVPAESLATTWQPEKQAAIMEKMRAEQSRFIASLKGKNEGDTSEEGKLNLQDLASEEIETSCSLCHDSHSQSPLCFLVFLQKSRLTTFVERDQLSWEDSAWQDHTGSREHSNDSSRADPNGIRQLTVDLGVDPPFNTESIEVSFLGSLGKQIQTLEKLEDDREDSVPLEKLEEDIYHSVIRNILKEQKLLSRDDMANSREDRVAEFFVLGEFVACLLRESKQNDSSIRLRCIANSSSRSITPTATISGFGPSDCDGIHISSCGHAVHQECHDRYMLSLKQRYNGQLGFEKTHIVDPELGELLCPVCRRFANSILPASTGVSNRFSMSETSIFGSSSLNDFPTSDTDCRNFHLLLSLSLLQNAAKMVEESRILKVLSGTCNEPTNSALKPALKKLNTLYGFGSLSETGRQSHSLILWDTLRYSIMSTEIAARAKLNAYSVPSCLDSLNGELNTSSGHMMRILLHVAQSIRSYNSYEVLLRLNSLQLLAGSICSGLSGDNHLLNGDSQRDTLSLFEYSHNGEVFPFAQFQKHAADPILAHDPFSSLMLQLHAMRNKILTYQILVALLVKYARRWLNLCL